jgi:hypothetical protein
MFEGDILNAYQKPSSVMRRILISAPPDERVVIDLTCGSGTTDRCKRPIFIFLRTFKRIDDFSNVLPHL